MTEPFTISQGDILEAKNLFIRVTLESGVCGYGEIAPFPELMGETQESCLTAATGMLGELIGLDVNEYRAISDRLAVPLGHHPAIRCGVETAIVDALAREKGIPLWKLWGEASVKVHETDITIPIRNTPETVQAIQQWHRQGFRIFKLKVGARLEDDLHTLSVVDTLSTDISFIIDANQGYTVEEALLIAKKLEGFKSAIRAFEQPVNRHDLDGMSMITANTSIPIAADESVFTLEDAQRVIQEKAADIINLKITKSGLFSTIDIAALCQANHMPLMIGGMIETRLAMGCSFSLVLGLGGISLLDLDTPLLMTQDPLSGDGYRYDGPQLFPWNSPGLGFVPVEKPDRP
ncbi:MAG: dipeptide epimerase [Nitrospirales bacterium]|nr:dipeptide epimerase [Nitrospira sp.]MDR4502024.1 dipeptide epimerase [Nitrospirales bacterium]